MNDAVVVVMLLPGQLPKEEGRLLVSNPSHIFNSLPAPGNLMRAGTRTCKVQESRSFPIL